VWDFAQSDHENATNSKPASQRVGVQTGGDAWTDWTGTFLTL